MKNIPITYYIAYNKPKEGQELLAKFGIKKARNVRDLAHKLDVLLIKKKEDALTALAAIHPDRELILAHVEKTDGEESSNACGCSGADGMDYKCSKCTKEKKSGVGGDTPNAFETIKPYAPLIIGGTLLLIGIVVVLKNA
jgi:hypothetical protein